MLAIAFLNRFFHWGAVGIASPVLVLLLLSKGIPVASVGLAVASMSAAVVLLELPSGILSDTVGRKRVYLASCGVAVAGYAALAASGGLAGACLALAVYGCSRALSSGSIEALMTDRFIEARGKERLPRLMAAMNCGEALGLALGAIAGGVLPALWRRIAPDCWEFGANLAGQALAVSLGAAVALAVPGENRPHKGRGAKGVREVAGAAIREARATLSADPIVARIVAGAAAWGLAFNAVEVYWQPRFAELIGEASGAAAFGLLQAAYFAAAVLGGSAAGLALGRLRAPVGLGILGALRLATAATFVALAFQGSADGFSIFYVALMLANGAASVAEGSALNAVLPSGARSSLLSLASLATQAGGIAAAVAFGCLKRYASVPVVWLVAALPFAASAALYLAPRRGVDKRTHEPRACPRASAGKAGSGEARAADASVT